MPSLIIDMDGVLTDGKQYVDHTGDKLFKAFHSRDIRAIRQFISEGYYVLVVTADDWPGGKRWCERVGADFMYSRKKTKAIVGLPTGEVLAVGDDAWDKDFLCESDEIFCPLDADAAIKNIPGVRVLGTMGGHGVIAELARLIFGEQ